MTGLLPPDAVAHDNEAQNFFGDSTTPVNITDVNVSRLCNLFTEGLN